MSDTPSDKWEPCGPCGGLGRMMRMADKALVTCGYCDGAMRRSLMPLSPADVDYVRTKLQQRADNYYLQTYREHFYCNGDAALDEEAANLLGMWKP